jgi:hypothetical protein
MRRWLLGLWGLEIAAVLVLSLLPARMVPENTVGADPEHAVAYLALAMLPTVALEKRRSAVAAAAGIALLGAVLEVCQLGIPGRAFEWSDIAANAGGAALGLPGGACTETAGAGMARMTMLCASPTCGSEASPCSGYGFCAPGGTTAGLDLWNESATARGTWRS